MLTRQRVVALGLLAATYARHISRRTLRLDRGGGLAAFRNLYGADRITAITPTERAQLGAHGECIACGLCGFAAQRAGYLRAERLPSQLTRSLPQLWTSRQLDLAAVDWEAGAAVCPLGVPLPAITGFVAQRLARDGSLPPPPAAPPVLPTARSPRIAARLLPAGLRVPGPED